MPNPTFTAFLLGLVDATSGDYKTLSADNDVWTLNRVLKLTEGDAHIVGEEAGDAILYLSADEADDNADQWRLRVQDGGTLTLETFTSGAWVAVTTWTPAGQVTSTSIPCFGARPTVSQDNIAIDSDVTVAFGSEYIDKGGDFAANTFTAPVTGSYAFMANLRLIDLDSAASGYTLSIVTSNRTYPHSIVPDKFSGDVAEWHLNIAVVADMDTNDTAFVRLRQTGGTQQTDIEVESWFSGWLVG